MKLRDMPLPDKRVDYDYDCVVILYPPAGAGTNLVPTSQGMMQQFAVGIEFKNVAYCYEADNGLNITLRNGDVVVTNLAYQIRYVKRQEMQE